MAHALLAFVEEIALLMASAAPFLLLGFVLAGLLRAFLSPEIVSRQFGGNGFGAVFRASLYGVPIPLCSCSVIPVAGSLQQNGAGRGATTAFMISTPETGVDSISVTYALLDPVMTVVRPLAAFLTALTTGQIVNWLDRRGALPQEEPVAEAKSCCASKAEPLALGARLAGGLRFAFGKLLDDLTPWFLLGFAISGLMAALLPPGFFGETVPSGLPSMLLMLVVSAPVYICATASTPIAAVMIAKGLDPGAALVFLLAGPATNATTMLVVRRMLGGRVLGVYVACIAVLSLAAGLLTSALFAQLGIDLGAVVREGHAHGPSGLDWAAAAVLAALFLGSALRIGLGGRILVALRIRRPAEK